MNESIELEKFADLQMAAEANLAPGRISAEALTNGNERASKFTQAGALKFASEWKVVEQHTTSTGFSGTVFECIKPDAERGLTAGERVLCFRSTEFADDSARDNQATNSLEIYDFGWAFGQIDDMRLWYADLLARGVLVPEQFSVTGYSLGGHLATAFNRLYTDPLSTYTFNGAGVGEVSQGTLWGAVQTFHDRRTYGADSYFTQSLAKQAYRDLRGSMNDLAAMMKVILLVPPVVLARDHLGSCLDRYPNAGPRLPLSSMT